MDANGNRHTGLPWVGCSVLATDTDTLRSIRAKAASSLDILIADMPAAAQQTRVYADQPEAYSDDVRRAVELGG